MTKNPIATDSLLKGFHKRRTSPKWVSQMLSRNGFSSNPQIGIHSVLCLFMAVCLFILLLLYVFVVPFAQFL
ncbi:hypothetical protein RchiOBHm_Chr5g0051771 [Rosa chinensis]|uniref:Uncharacterized protein n=1 Tax=Rosa chinensis TaxID=74649 RepID=A0A2P6QFG6_ROSCH|nr:hypothetical protein RchiOBHm_Chr5g0051771 [Rosa chinensis]